MGVSTTNRLVHPCDVRGGWLWHLAILRGSVTRDQHITTTPAIPIAMPTQYVHRTGSAVTLAHCTKPKSIIRFVSSAAVGSSSNGVQDQRADEAQHQHRDDGQGVGLGHGSTCSRNTDTRPRMYPMASAYIGAKMPQRMAAVMRPPGACSCLGDQAGSPSRRKRQDSRCRSDPRQARRCRCVPRPCSMSYACECPTGRS